MSLTINNLRKTFDTPNGKIDAVDDLSIDVAEGEFIIFVGPSGCGKTTTLRCIAGLETPSDGEIHIDGARVDHLRPQERDIGMVFQNYALYPHLTVRQNIGFGLKHRSSLSMEEIDDRVTEIAEMMGIAEFLEKKPGQLSGGQQQRVATGRAIVRDPSVYLFDEPLSNLDAKLRSHMRTELQRLQNDFETTTIYVTHDQQEAMTMADRIAVMKNGKLQQIGEPTELYNRPRNKFIAEFIGEPSINFFNVEVDGNVLRHDHFEYEVSDELAMVLAEKEDLTLGVRPEDIVVDKVSDMRVTVQIVEELGNHNLLHVSFTDDGDLYTSFVQPTFKPAIGDDLGVSFDESSIYLFDRVTGDALQTKSDQHDRETATEVP